MAMLRLAFFAVFAAWFVSTSEATLRIRSPSEPTVAKQEKKTVQPLQAVEGGKGTEDIDISTTGQVDADAEDRAAEKGRPIEEDKMPKPTVAEVTAAAPEEPHDQLRKGMEKADPEHQKDSGVFNPMTGQVETAFVQVGRKSTDDDEDVSDEEEDMSGESESEDESQDVAVSGGEETDAADVESQESDESQESQESQDATQEDQEEDEESVAEENDSQEQEEESVDEDETEQDREDAAMKEDEEEAKEGLDENESEDEEDGSGVYEDEEEEVPEESDVGASDEDSEE